MKVLNYELKPFRTIITIIFDKDVKSGLKYLIDEHNAKVDINPYDESNTIGILGNGLDKDNIPSWFMIFEEDSFNFGVLAHECLHAVLRISEHKGMDLNKDNQEFYAYALEDMFNFISKEKDNE